MTLDRNIQLGQGSAELIPGDNYVWANSPFRAPTVIRLLISLCHCHTDPMAGMISPGKHPLDVNRLAQKKFMPSAPAATSIQGSMVFIASVTVMYCLFLPIPRYATPFRPFEILLATSPLYWLWSWFQEHRLKPAEA